jgi:hypothetical protein
LSQRLTPELMRYHQLQYWDGKLPVFSSGVSPLIDATSSIRGTTGRSAAELADQTASSCPWVILMLGAG